jgi:hypothetical protein
MEDGGWMLIKDLTPSFQIRHFGSILQLIRFRKLRRD